MEGSPHSSVISNAKGGQGQSSVHGHPTYVGGGGC